MCFKHIIYYKSEKMNKIKEILEKAKKDYEIQDDFKIIIKKLKLKGASISMGKRIIRLNEDLIHDSEIIVYLIYHELAHYKLHTRFHGYEFYKLLNSKLGEEKVKAIERKIHRKMYEMNHLSRIYGNGI